MGITRSITRDIVRPVTRDVVGGLGGASDPILALFANGEQGAYAYPTDQRAPDGDYISFTDTGGTTPATSHNDPVGYIRDISGKGNDFVAPNDAARFKLILSGGLWSWEADGVDDFLETANISSKVFSPTTGLMCVGASSSDPLGIGGIVEEESLVANERVALYGDTRASPKRIAVYAPDATTRYVDRVSQWDGSTQVLTAHVSGSNFVGRIDGSDVDTIAHGSATFSAATKLRIGKQDAGDVFFEGNIYGFVFRDDPGDIGVIEARIAELSGVTL